jgi:hypothetical protein
VLSIPPAFNLSQDQTLQFNLKKGNPLLQKRAKLALLESLRFAMLPQEQGFWKPIVDESTRTNCLVYIFKERSWPLKALLENISQPCQEGALYARK